MLRRNRGRVGHARTQGFRHGAATSSPDVSNLSHDLANLCLGHSLRRRPMKKIALILAVCVMSGPAFATCKSDAADKKLAGAALKSFMTKCEKDAATTCEADSKEKKLAGAAKTSHMKKCVGDAVGT